MILGRLQAGYEVKSLDWPARVIEFILAALLFIAPFAFGIVDPWSEQVALVLVGCMAVLFMLRLLLISDVRVCWHGSYVLLFLFILIVSLQLIALPSDLVRLLSPHTVDIKTNLLSGLAISNLNLSRMTLSFYPNATVHDLRLILAVATVFFIAFNQFTSLASIKRLLTYITVVGGAVAILAVLQFLTQTDKIYWVVPIPPHTLADGGPFVNHSHFSQFMNLSVGAAMSLILIRIRELSMDVQQDFSILGFLRSPEAKSLLLPILTVVLGATAVFISLSRGGIISLLLAGSFITLLMALGSHQKGRGRVIAIMVLAAFACVLYIGFDAVYERMATLHELDPVQSGRLQILRNVIAAWGQFPLFGTGLGTHSVVYPMFNTLTTSALASHAENEYAQVLEETGIMGLLLLFVFIAFVGKAFIYSIQNKHDTINVAAYGLAFGLLAVMIHSFSDFGQHIPANAFLSAIFCALLLRMGTTTSAVNPNQEMMINSVSFVRRVVSVICLMLVMSLWGMFIFQANKARIADEFWTKSLNMEVYFDQVAWQGTNPQYVELLKSAETASDYQPANVRYRHWLNVYRWRSISRQTDPNTGEVILSPKGIQTTLRIVSEFKNACVVCPTFGPTYCVLGQLEAMVLGDPNGLQHIDVGYRLAPCDPTVCLISGSVDAQQGNYRTAFSKLKRAVQLNSDCFQEAAVVCLQRINDPNDVLALAGNNLSLLNSAAALISEYEGKDGSPETLAKADEALAKVKVLLEKRSQQADAPADIFASLGAVYWRNQDLDRAVDLYRKALIKDYSQTPWRYKLAQILAEQGRFDEAIHEAKICLRLDSEFYAAKRLIEDISVKEPESEVVQQ